MIPAVCRWDAVFGGGGLTAERRAFREGIRLQASERFAAGEKTTVIAKDLRVSVRSVERWRRPWREGGMDALPRPILIPSSRCSRRNSARDRRNAASRISVGRWPECRRCSTSAAA
ncbi:helix-turn-helix domain-containing protein [Streptomyces sp. NPDC005386]|uniref:helix-turn-helix domain-containing protein n=1 Tax=Streptomyces sp. NPDC005386 TaxID=3154562 RepID=UPI0033A11A41